MFCSGMSESLRNEVNIDDIHPDVFEQIVQFMYTGTCWMEIQKKKQEIMSVEDFTIQLLKAAHQYDLDGLSSTSLQLILLRLKFL